MSTKFAPLYGINDMVDDYYSKIMNTILGCQSFKVLKSKMDTFIISYSSHTQKDTVINEFKKCLGHTSEYVGLKFNNISLTDIEL